MVGWEAVGIVVGGIETVPDSRDLFELSEEDFNEDEARTTGLGSRAEE